MAAQRYFPVCCTVDVPAGVIHSFLESSYKKSFASAREYDTDADEEDSQDLVVIRNIADKHTSPTIPPVSENVTNSPFRSKSNQECLEILGSIYKETGSEIDTLDFVVMDERSLTDSTVLIVADEGSSDEDDQLDGEDNDINTSDKTEDVAFDGNYVLNRSGAYVAPNGDGPTQDHSMIASSEDDKVDSIEGAEEYDSSPGGLQTVRCSFESASGLLMLLSIGKIGCSDARRTARAGDGVFRD